MRIMYDSHFDTFDEPGYIELHNMEEDFANLASYMLIDFPKSARFLLGRLRRWASDSQVGFQRIMGKYNNIVREAAAQGNEINCKLWFYLMSSVLT